MQAIDYSRDLARAGAGVHTRWDRLRFTARRYPLGAVGALLVAIIVCAAVFAGVVTWVDPLSTDAGATLQAPSWLHPMGTDALGRDVYSRVLFGARTSLAVGIGATVLGGSVGTVAGVLSGYFGGWIDLVVQRLSEMLQALPLLVLALVISAALGPSLRNVVLAIAIPIIPHVARVVRSSALSLRELPFVEAARSMGMSDVHIALRHVLPNTLAPLIVLATAQLGSAILIEASLSFLGVGVPEPYPSWGRMLADSADYIGTAPWLIVAPGLAITAAVFGTNLLGDALRDILDPRQRT